MSDLSSPPALNWRDLLWRILVTLVLLLVLAGLGAHLS
jgi:hypothetical protein